MPAVRRLAALDRAEVGGAHGATPATASALASTTPKRLSGQTRSTAVPTTASRGTTAGTTPVTGADEAHVVARDATDDREVVLPAGVDAEPLGERGEDPPDEAVVARGRTVDRSGRRGVHDDDVTGLERRADLPHEDAVSWFQGRRQGARGDEVALQQQALHKGGEHDRGREQHHDRWPLTT